MNKKCWCCSWKHHKTHHWVQLSFFSDGLLLRIVPVKVQCSCFLCLHYINHDDDDTKELSDCNKEMVAADLHSIFLIEAIKYFGWWWWVTGVHHNINTHQMIESEENITHWFRHHLRSNEDHQTKQRIRSRSEYLWWWDEVDDSQIQKSDH